MTRLLLRKGKTLFVSYLDCIVYRLHIYNVVAVYNLDSSYSELLISMFCVVVYVLQLLHLMAWQNCGIVVARNVSVI